ncbi:glycoside hydrolase family 76 protein [Deinococcus sp.]|uniref:glycoside hydrolase family 76 protein n=1 Tax=Deinococcus sp. TaxID=47478 RepID=UPI003B5B48C0
MNRRIMLLAVLTTGLMACGQTPAPSAASPKMSPKTQPASLDPLGVAEDRDTAGMAQLLSFFDAATGAWNTPTGEAWQPALGLDAVINTYERTREVKYLNVIEKSFQRYNGRRSYYFDDDGWYLNAWLRIYDVTGDPKYLSEAKNLFEVMKGAWDDKCGGGVWWNKDYAYKNAVTNELFLLSAARLARRAGNGSGPGSYQNWANRSWNWFRASGMINAQHLVNDGLGSDCQSNGGITWTYNQGVILGALVELWRSSGDRAYLYSAEQIAEATMSGQVYSSGVLREPCEIGGNCDGDQQIFKGPFVQGLARLYNADRRNKPQYADFLNRNADSLWNASRTPQNGLGLRWVGPVGSPNQASQAAGQLLIGGLALLNAGGETANISPLSGSVYEAEAAARSGVGTESLYSGYSGSGYVAGWIAGGQNVTFTVPSASSRSALVTFRYAGGAGDALRTVTVNGVTQAAALLFTGTGSWNTWNTVSLPLPLNAGSNTVSLNFDSGKGSSNYLNLDHLEVK